MTSVERTMAQTRARLEALRDPLAAGDKEAAEAALDGLWEALEEVDVLLEELHQQNAELSAARAELAEERERFADLFQHAPEPYLVTTTDGVVLQGNTAAADLLGVPEARLPRRILALALPPAERAAFRERLRALPAAPEPFELTIVPRDHAAVVVSATVLPTERDDGTTELRWLLRDVTDARRAQMALQTAFARSREEADELRELDRWKDAFLAATAHDLRAPLTVITNASETLLERFELEEGRSLVEMIEGQARRLRRLLDDLLDLDRFTRGTVTAQRAPTNLADLVASVMAEVTGHAHRLEADVPPVVAHLDAARTGQIITNLVDNAVTHTPPGTLVTVRVRPAGDGVDVVVEDAGPGVPADLREEVFRPFVTRPAHDGDTLGTGLGLSLVQLFTELHGGTAHVEDSTTGGARFVVHLPAEVSG